MPLVYPRLFSSSSSAVPFLCLFDLPCCLAVLASFTCRSCRLHHFLSSLRLPASSPSNIAAPPSFTYTSGFWTRLLRPRRIANPLTCRANLLQSFTTCTPSRLPQVRRPWPFIALKMSDTDDDKPLVKGNVSPKQAFCLLNPRVHFIPPSLVSRHVQAITCLCLHHLSSLSVFFTCLPSCQTYITLHLFHHPYSFSKTYHLPTPLILKHIIHHITQN